MATRFPAVGVRIAMPLLAVAGITRPYCGNGWNTTVARWLPGADSRMALAVNVGSVVWFSAASVSVAASPGSNACGVTEVAVPAVVHRWACHRYAKSAGVASLPMDM